MKAAAPRRPRISERINSLVTADKPFRQIAGNVSKIAKTAMDEASSLSLERVDIQLDRLPRKLNGFKIIHLSDIHHSPFTNLEHIERAVEIANRLRPDMFI